MKKNRMMRLASVMLVAVLMTTCTISGTFAKYVTEATGTDSARVAKWGVTITHDNNIFYDAYKDTYVDHTANESVDTITVQADTEGADVVAPGTKGVMTNFDISGTPEVDVKVTYSAELNLVNWKIYKEANDQNYSEYCPIVITVEAAGRNGKLFYIGMEDAEGANVDTVDKLETAVESYINSYSNTYHTNTDLSAVEDDLKISWSWAFNGEDHPATSYQTDNYDTALGNWNFKGLNEPTISISVTCTVTQID